MKIKLTLRGKPFLKGGAFLFLIALAFLAFADHPMNSDEGNVLNSAWNLWNGQRLYLDYQEFVTPGSYYGVFFLWKIIQVPSYASAKLLSIALFLLSGWGLLKCVRLLGGKFRACFFALIVWLLACQQYPLINYNVYSSFAAIGFLYFVLRFQGSKRWEHLELAGGMGALTFLLLQTKGLLLFGATVFFLLFFYRSSNLARRQTWFLFGVLLVPLAVVTTLLCFVWPPQALYYHWFTLPFTSRYLDHTSHEPSIFIQGALILLILFLIARIHSRLHRRRKSAFWVLFCFQTGLFLSSLHLVDFAHLAITTFPFIVYLAIGVEKLVDRFRLKRLLFVFLCLPFLAWTTRQAYSNFWSDFGRRTVYQDIFGGESIQRLFPPEVLEAKHLYFGPFLPGLYFETRKPNPFPTGNMLTCDSQCQKQMLIIFNRIRPEFALFDYAMVAKKFDYPLNNPIDQYIQKNYSSCGSLPNISLELYAKGSCPPRSSFEPSA